MRVSGLTAGWIAAFLVALPATTSVWAQQAAAPAPAMTMSIPSFMDGGAFPVQFSQAAAGVAPGEGTSPAISWANAPAATKSFLLHMHDLDVTRNGTTDDQLHWLIWGIPAIKKGLPEGVPKGAQLTDGSYQVSATGPMYRGPGAAASGPLHHYVFELYALDFVPDIKPAGDGFETRVKVLAAIQGHVLAKAVYGALFRRPPS